MDEIAFDDVVLQLIDALPELRDEYATMLAKWPDQSPGAYVVYDLYIDHVVKLSAQTDDPAARDGLERAFALLERLSCSEDFDVRCLVETGIAEALLDMEQVLRKVSRYMGPATRVRLRQCARGFGLGADFLADMGLL